MVHVRWGKIKSNFQFKLGERERERERERDCLMFGFIGDWLTKIDWGTCLQKFEALNC